MGWFHALAAEGDIPNVVYHLCPQDHWDENGAVYYPKHYDVDKFTRATFDPSKLTEIGTCFYGDAPITEEWICLQINTTGLKFNGIEVTMEESAENPELKCARVYGGFPRETVTKVYNVQRASDGTFVSIRGLTDATCCPAR